jgi:hypothetical protein
MPKRGTFITTKLRTFSQNDYRPIRPVLHKGVTRILKRKLKKKHWSMVRKNTANKMRSKTTDSKEFDRALRGLEKAKQRALPGQLYEEEVEGPTHRG